MARSSTKAVYALVGDDSFLQTEALRAIVELAGSDVQRIDLDGERAELAEVLDELRSFAMFGGSKLAVVRNADPFVTRYRAQLENYVESPSQGSVLVLRLLTLPSNTRISKLIAKNGEVIKCEPPKDVARWIIDRGKKEHGITVLPDAAAALSELIGADLGRLDNELAKLALQYDSGKIDAKAVAASVSFQREQEMWDMTGELAAGRTEAALRRWRQLIQLDSSAEFRAVTWLGMWLEDVGRALRSKQQGRMNEFMRSAGWKYKGDRLNAFLRNAESLGMSGYRRALRRLAQTDHRIKSGIGDAASSVEDFLLSLAPARGR
jgi:DNA polymerase-3 subunit delta